MYRFFSQCTWGRSYGHYFIGDLTTTESTQFELNVTSCLNDVRPSCSMSNTLASVITAIVTALLATVVFALVQIVVCKCHPKLTSKRASAKKEGREVDMSMGHLKFAPKASVEEQYECMNDEAMSAVHVSMSHPKFGPKASVEEQYECMNDEAMSAVHVSMSHPKFGPKASVEEQYECMNDEAMSAVHVSMSHPIFGPKASVEEQYEYMNDEGISAVSMSHPKFTPKASVPYEEEYECMDGCEESVPAKLTGTAARTEELREYEHMGVENDPVYMEVGLGTSFQCQLNEAYGTAAETTMTQ